LIFLSDDFNFREPKLVNRTPFEPEELVGENALRIEEIPSNDEFLFFESFYRCIGDIII
jgi:hypothetical protein